MNEGRARVITDAATAERKSSIVQRQGVNSRDADVNRVSLHMLAVFRNTRRAGAKEFIAPRGAIPTNDVDLRLDREAAKRSFDGFLLGKTPSANQIEFINLMIDHLTQRGWMEPSALYESPFTDISPRGVEGIFPSKEIEQLIGVLASIRQHAEL